MDGGSRHCTGDRNQDHSQEKKCKKAKLLSEEALQIAVKKREMKNKGEKERYTHLNAEFDRIVRRDKNTRPLYLPPEISVCRSRSNS